MKNCEKNEKKWRNRGGYIYIRGVQEENKGKNEKQ